MCVRACSACVCACVRVCVHVCVCVFLATLYMHACMQHKPDFMPYSASMLNFVRQRMALGSA